MVGGKPGGNRGHQSLQQGACCRQKEITAIWCVEPRAHSSREPRAPRVSMEPLGSGNPSARPRDSQQLGKTPSNQGNYCCPNHCLLRCLPPAALAGDNISLLFLKTTGTTNNTAADEGPSKPSRAEEPGLGLRGGNRSDSPRGARGCTLPLPGLSGGWGP